MGSSVSPPGYVDELVSWLERGTPVALFSSSHEGVISSFVAFPFLSYILWLTVSLASFLYLTGSFGAESMVNRPVFLSIVSPTV